MLDLLNELAQNAMNAITQGNPTALLSLFIISALTEVGIPFPFIVDTILIVTGLQTGIIAVKVGLIMLSLMFGRLIGASVIYWLTRGVGRAFVNWISKRFPFIQRRMDWLTTKLNRQAPIAVAIARLTPGLLTPSTVAAGIIPVHYWQLLLGIAISSVIADGVLLILGYTTGRGLEQFGFKMNFWIIVVIVVIIIGIIWFVSHILSRRNTK
jgi:membrane protein DedA with SNARE-associated domain